MGDSYPKLKVAAVQAAPVWLNREATVEKACNLIKTAGANGASLVVFPECFIPAFPIWLAYYRQRDPVTLRSNMELYKNAVEIPSEATDRLCQAAKEANAYVVMGMNEKRPGVIGTLYNSQLFIHRNGTILGKRQKLMPTTIERLIHGLGDGSLLKTYPTEFGPLGGLMCCENGNPLFRYALYCQGEVLHAASWPTYAYPNLLPRVHDNIIIRIRNTAWEGKLFVISSCMIFTDEMADAMEINAETRKKITVRGGKSAVVDPEGQYLAGPIDEPIETIVYADIDMEQVVQARLITDYTGHYQRADVVSLLYNPATFASMRVAAPTWENVNMQSPKSDQPAAGPQYPPPF
jgi:nitrilase